MKRVENISLGHSKVRWCKKVVYKHPVNREWQCNQLYFFDYNRKIIYFLKFLGYTCTRGGFRERNHKTSHVS